MEENTVRITPLIHGNPMTWIAPGSFEHRLLPEIANLIKKSQVNLKKVIFNFPYLKGMDMEEMLCLPIIADYLRVKKNWKTEFLFSIYPDTEDEEKKKVNWNYYRLKDT